MVNVIGDNVGWRMERQDRLTDSDRTDSVIHTLDTNVGEHRFWRSGADPGPGQTVVRLLLLSARSELTFLAAKHHKRPLVVPKLYCLMKEAHACEQLAQVRCLTRFATMLLSPTHTFVHLSTM